MQRIRNLSEATNSSNSVSLLAQAHLILYLPLKAQAPQEVPKRRTALSSIIRVVQPFSGKYMKTVKTVLRTFDMFDAVGDMKIITYKLRLFRSGPVFPGESQGKRIYWKEWVFNEALVAGECILGLLSRLLHVHCWNPGHSPNLQENNCLNRWQS